MITDVFRPVFYRIVLKLQDVLSTSWGVSMTAFSCVLSFLAPVRYAFLVVGIAILLDMVFGVASALKQRKFFLSNSAKDTFLKIFIYGGPLLLVFFIEGVLEKESFYITKSLSVVAACCELWSMLASALIIAPKMLFPKILRVQLKGEVESKLGKNVSNLLDKEPD